MPSLSSYMNTGYNVLLDILFPISCLGCKKPKQYICDACIQSIAPATDILYSTHALPTLTRENLSGVVPVASYQQSQLLQKALHALKYNFITSLAQPLGKSMAHRLHAFLTLNPKSWIMLPVPLHPRKKRERGFNQNELLMGSCIACLPPQTKQHLTLLYDSQSPLVRSRYSATQVRSSKLSRISNMHNAFKIKDSSIIKGRSVIIVDDVITTGATLKAAASAVKNAGAHEVWGFVLAYD